MIEKAVAIKKYVLDYSVFCFTIAADSEDLAVEGPFKSGFLLLAGEYR